ncbi:MAG: hypothetical protein WKF42_02745 [Solirubrobacteraceae bacterium]
MATGVPVERAAPRLASVAGSVLALAGLVATAGVIHVVAAVQHVAEDWWLGVFFVLVGAGQLLAGWRIYRWPEDRRLLSLAAVGGVVVALLWAFSRTTGIPFGPEAGKVSAVGVADTIATLQELAFAALVVALVRRPEPGVERLAWLNGGLGVRLTPAILSASLFIAAIGGHEH